jgi:DNA-directed RNA polymerase subunit K/omega
MIWPKDRLTRFEVARLIGARSLQISLGAPIFVKSEKILNPIQLAKLEFKNKILPITIKRELPNGEINVIEIRSAIENWLTDHDGEI